MKKILMLTAYLSILSPAVFAAPHFMTQQGRVHEADGTPITGVDNVTFSIYTAETGGSQIWTETMSVVFDDGYYSVMLGTDSSIEASMLDNDELYLGVTLSDNNEFSPRNQLASVPFALRAESVEGTVIATGGLTVDGQQVIDDSGNWVGENIDLLDESALETYMSDNSYLTQNDIENSLTTNSLTVNGDIEVTGTATFVDNVTVQEGITLEEVESVSLPSSGYGVIYASAGSEVDSNVKLLLHGDGAGTNFIDSSSSSHNVSSLGGAVQETISTPKFGNAIYFDGNNDYLSVPDSPDWAFGNGDFTIDLWVYPENLSPGNSQYLVTQWGNGLLTWIMNGGIVSVRVGGASQDLTSSEPLPNANQWYHIAVVRSSNIITLYINGTAAGSQDVGNLSITNSTSALTIGMIVTPNSNWFEGYMDEIQISKGIARWTSDFTPPSESYGGGGLFYKQSNGAVTGLTGGSSGGGGSLWSQNEDNLYYATGNVGVGTEEPGEQLTVGGAISLKEQDSVNTPPTEYGTIYLKAGSFSYDSQTKLMLHGDGTVADFTDDSDSDHNVTAIGDATQSSAQSKSGGKSMKFDADGDYLTLSDSSDWNFGTGDFTIDFWWYFESKGDGIYGFTSNYAYQFLWRKGQNAFFLWDGDQNQFWSPAWNPSEDQWYHLAFVREGNTFRIFIDGTELDSTDVSGLSFSHPSDSTPGLCVACGWNSGQHQLKGYLDEFRISKGIARWTSDFTPPDSVAGEQPGLYFTDSDGNEFRLTMQPVN